MFTSHIGKEHDTGSTTNLRLRGSGRTVAVRLEHNVALKDISRSISASLVIKPESPLRCKKTNSPGACEEGRTPQ